jgi:Putative Actinobacterial Holin-X, holin superfamily III
VARQIGRNRRQPEGLRAARQRLLRCRSSTMTSHRLRRVASHAVPRRTQRYAAYFGHTTLALVNVLLTRRIVMSQFTATENQRSLGQVVKDLTADLSTLFRSEIALLKLEIKDMVAKLGGGAALFAGALFLALIGLAFLFVTATLGLVALGVPAWLSSLIMTIVMFVAAGVLAMMGKKKFEAVKFVPSASVEQIKSDIESLKSDIARVRSR